ncbi:hypothetical protein BH20ACI4_BH20ACI4_27470 [soil metagenome]
MITLRETKKKIIENPEWWRIALMDFVDDFRHHKNPEAIVEPFDSSDEKIDAVLASTAESLCDEFELPIPVWLNKISACREPYFVSGLENLKATAIVQSPLRFRIRKIFVLENFLTRV